MKPLYSPNEFSSAKANDLLPFECYCCNKKFLKKKKYINAVFKKTSKAGSIKFCSIQCSAKSLKNKQLVSCANCNDEFLKLPNQINKSKNNFCSRSCAATYNNNHKQHGNRRSKLEAYLEKQLTLLYPNLKFDFNRKDAINSELDIYIPSLKLAFELNGIYHYEPIHGPDKLNQTQNNDQRKFQACVENGISLCIIDTSKQKYFKESTSKEFLNIITDIINNNSKNIY